MPQERPLSYYPHRKHWFKDIGLKHNCDLTTISKLFEETKP